MPTRGGAAQSIGRTRNAPFWGGQPAPAAPDLTAFYQGILDAQNQASHQPSYYQPGGGGGYPALTNLDGTPYNPADWAPGGSGYIAAHDPAQNPAYQAYSKALDLEEQNLQAGRTRMAGNLAVNRDQNLTNLGHEYDDHGGIMDRLRSTFEQRGAIRSGAYEAGKAQQGAQREQRAGQLQQGYQQSVNDLEAQVAQQLMEINRRRQDALIQFAGG